MDVFNVGSRQAAKAPEGRSLERRAPASGTTSARPRADRVTDTYAGSARASKVEQRVNRLATNEVEEVRPEMVAKFRALMDLGELDTGAAAFRAAEGILDGKG